MFTGTDGRLRVKMCSGSYCKCNIVMMADKVSTFHLPHLLWKFWHQLRERFIQSHITKCKIADDNQCQNIPFVTFCVKILTIIKTDIFQSLESLITKYQIVDDSQCQHIPLVACNRSPLMMIYNTNQEICKGCCILLYLVVVYFLFHWHCDNHFFRLCSILL